MAPLRKHTKRAKFLRDNLDLPAATGVEGAKWEHFQMSHLNDDSTFRIEVKSRQIAWSWLSAAESLADALLDKRDSVYVSINQDEAMEKIRYARHAYDCLRITGIPKIIRDSLTDIEFDNGARLTSLTSKAPRGRARANLYLDEFAHVGGDRQIYTATLPIISKGGRLRIGSSPFGSIGVFWEIFDEAVRPYPGFTRKRTPWWEVQAFCKDVRLAWHLAPKMPTEERIDRFGNDRIIAIYSNIFLEDFQQEYECAFNSVTDAWFAWQEIRDAQDPKLSCFKANCYGKSVGGAINAIESLARLIEAGRIEHVFAGGIDIGRKKDATEIFLVGVGRDHYPLRLMISLKNTEFETQRDIMTYMLNRLPIGRLMVDKTGIGMNLAESLHKLYPYKVYPVDFTIPAKIMWAGDAKALLQSKKTPIPVDRDLAYQIHSLKRIVTASKQLRFDVDKSETKSNADMAWAWMLSLSAAKQMLFVTANTGNVGQSVVQYW